MSKAIRLHKQGGPEVMVWEDIEVGEPGPGQARVRHNACGLNYIDVYHRSGLYPLPMPSGIGMEAAGVVEAVGQGVTNVKKGDRVAYAAPPVGAYAEVRLMAADRLVNLPDAISFDQGAAMMLQGMTAQYLLKRTYKVKPGDTILGLNLSHGGHLSHGHPLNFSGRYFKVVPYMVDKQTETLDYAAIRALALEHKPRVIVSGASAGAAASPPAPIASVLPSVAALKARAWACF